MSQFQIANPVETIIIGFGMAAIPILRELDKTGEEYFIISENKNIWREMKKKGKLAFDLVSTKSSTFFSWDLTKGGKDYFPTANEFYEYQAAYYEKYKEQIIKDEVVRIENFEDHSKVYTKTGETYRAKNVILASGFNRKVAESIASFDSGVTNKTIVFDTMGDTTNMFVSNLVGGGNQIYALSNGFTPLNKIYKSRKWELGNIKTGGEYTLDQFEFQNLAFLSKGLYEDTIGMSFGSFISMGRATNESFWKIFRNKNNSPLDKLKITSSVLKEKALFFLAKGLSRNSFHVKYNINRNQKVERPTEMPVLNQPILKYWPIDAYEKIFGGSLKESIPKGYKLNDMPFFIDEGLVELLPKNQVKIDEASKELDFDGGRIKYDYLIKGDMETPRLNDIEIIDSSGETYEYCYRENYLGVVPLKLKNVYVAGLTRPTTGGIGNITEIQSLLIHKSITNKSFKRKLFKNINKRTEEYNNKYYAEESPSRVDHIVYYGFYTEEVARAIGINLRLRDCKSRSDYFNFFLIPNNTSKYRVNGEYKVDKMRAFYRGFRRQYPFLDILRFLTTYGVYRTIYYSLTILATTGGYLSLPMGLFLLFAQTYFSRIFFLFIENAPMPKFFTSLIWLTSLPFIPLHWNLFIIGAEIALIPILKRFGQGTVFNDLSTRRKYKKFFYETYLPALRREMENSS